SHDVDEVIGTHTVTSTPLPPGSPCPTAPPPWKATSPASKCSKANVRPRQLRPAAQTRHPSPWLTPVTESAPEPGIRARARQLRQSHFLMATDTRGSTRLLQPRKCKVLCKVD